MKKMGEYLHKDQVPRSVLRDLVAISSLPELWMSRTAAEIATGLTGMLLNMISLDLVYACYKAGLDGHKIEVFHSKRGELDAEERHRAVSVFNSLFDPEQAESVLSIENPIGQGLLQIYVLRIGITGMHGFLVAGSLAANFPHEDDRLLLRIASNQALAIFQQKQVEDELQRQQRELIDFFENASEGLHWVGPDGTILWANKAELDLLGVTRDEYIGRNFADFHADPDIAQDIMNRLTHDQPVTNYEARLRCKDNSVKHVLINSRVYRENGNFIHTQCFTRDVTERKRIEEALRESEERFRALLNQATAGILRKKLDGTLLFVNQAFCDMLGYSAAELVGRPIWDFAHPEDVEANKQLYDQLMLDGLPFRLEKRFIRKDGSTLWVNASVSPVTDKEGKPQSAVAVEVDITARKQVEKALAQLNLDLENEVEQRTAELKVANQALRKNRLKLIEVQEEERRALARELHDRVGQSLTALKLNLTILQGQLSQQTLERVGKRLTDSIQLLDETIPAVRDVMSDLRPSVLDEYGLEAALRLYVKDFTSRYGIHVNFSKPKAPLLRFDNTLEMILLRIAQEALFNIAKHAQASDVNLSILQEDTGICLTVEDNGVGFEANASIHPKSHGLNIMRERAEAAGGTFLISTMPGNGTKVEAVIPYQVAYQSQGSTKRTE